MIQLIKKLEIFLIINKKLFINHYFTIINDAEIPIRNKRLGRIYIESYCQLKVCMTETLQEEQNKNRYFSALTTPIR